MAISQHSRILYAIFAATLLLAVSYATAQYQGHPWSEIILPSDNNIWIDLNADKLDGMHFANFSGRLWSGYDPATSNIWYNDGGNVGIGTSNPQYTLDVSGNVRSTGDVTGNRFCIGTDCITSWSSAGSSLWSQNGNDIYYNSGNVGIGTASPAEKLEISGGSLYVHGSSGGQGRVIMRIDSGHQWEWYPAASSIGLYDRTAGDYKIQITNTGNVGIGISSPSERLDVGGNIKASGDVTGSRLCIGTSCRNSWPSGGDTDWTESGGNVYRSSGNVGIGTASPDGKLNINGGLTWTTNGWRKGIRLDGDSSIELGGGAATKFGIGASGNRLYFFQTSTETSSGDSAHYVMNIDNSGNVRANDYYISSTGKWASQLGNIPSSYYKSCSGGNNVPSGCTVSCNTGDIRTGCSGTCRDSTDGNIGNFNIIPSGTNGCSCSGDDTLTCYVYCLHY